MFNYLAIFILLTGCKVETYYDVRCTGASNWFSGTEIVYRNTKAKEISYGDQYLEVTNLTGDKDTIALTESVKCRTKSYKQ